MTSGRLPVAPTGEYTSARNSDLWLSSPDSVMASSPKSYSARDTAYGPGAPGSVASVGPAGEARGAAKPVAPRLAGADMSARSGVHNVTGPRGSTAGSSVISVSVRRSADS